jgi:GAF domain-containing protein/anti-sigma regulatory factor (Ser/Thr protein kinase)
VIDPGLAELDLEALLAELAARTCQTLDAERCTIVLADGAQYGADDERLHELARRSIELGALVTDAAGAAAPLAARTIVHGAIAVIGEHFSDGDLEVLQLVANRASVALEHARALDAERAARRRLEDLQSVTDAALAHLDLGDLLDELLIRIRGILGADTAAILLLDERSNELVARAARGLEEEVEAGVRIPVGLGFAGRVAAERRPILLPDVDHADVLNPILREKGIKTLLGVPLLIEGDPIGVLHVGTLTPRVFTDVEVDILQLVADRAALAIEHSRVFEAERSARLRLENVQAVTDAALGHLELDDLLDELLLRVRSILGADTAAVLLLDERSNELVARAARGLEEEVEAGVRIPVGGGFAGRVASERRPIILPDVDHADVLNPILREKGIKTLLGIPLIAGDDVIGVMHVGTLFHREFTEEDVQLLQLVAERAAIAIERARLHDEMVQLDELQRNFVAIASHELRTPAASVYGALTTLRARGDELPHDTRVQLSEVAWQEADRMRRLIEQLLDLSRLDSGKVRLELQEINVRDFLAALVGSLRDVELKVDEALVARVDPLVLERVVVNLVANARTYGEPPVRLEGVTDGETLTLVIEDHGPGVPIELVPRLFDRFVRGREGHGSGLGLAIARAYTSALDGDLRYARAQRGARFEIVLPGAVLS